MKCLCDKSMFEQRNVDIHALHTSQQRLVHTWLCDSTKSFLSCLVMAHFCNLSFLYIFLKEAKHRQHAFRDFYIHGGGKLIKIYSPHLSAEKT